jgi:hypothetical protein
MLCEIRIGGDKAAQTIFPGSVHESGEPIVWEENGEPASVKDDELLTCVKLVAATSLIARHWPPEGGRHDAARCVGGLLARAGFPEERIKLVAEAIAPPATKTARTASLPLAMLPKNIALAERPMGCRN